MPDPNEIVLVIPDLQSPFEHPDALEFCVEVKKRFRPTRIVCVGDEADKHGLSDYDKDPDGLSPGHELEKCIEHLQGWYKAFPKVSVCTSNHTDRIFRKAYRYGIPVAYLKTYREFLGAPKGWQWRDDWFIDGVRYEHGHALSSSGSGRSASFHLPLLNRQSTVFGHFHSYAGIQYVFTENGLMMFGFNVGCLIDKEQYAFQYGKKYKQKPVLGCGILIRGVPMFIPLMLDRYGRWIGDLPRF
jgi:hypothetical protein